MIAPIKGCGSNLGKKRYNNLNESVDTMPLDALPFCILSIDSAGKISSANSYAESVFRLSPADLKGKKLSKLIYKDDTLLSLANDTLNHSIVMKAYDHEIRLKDKRTLRAHLYVSPIWAGMEAGEKSLQPQGAYIAIDPLLGADRIGKHIAQQDIAKRAGLMAAMLAHEVKNPLSGIRGAAQLLQEESEESGNEETRRLTSLIMKEVDRISGTLNKVEFLTHSGETERKPVNIHEVLHYARTVLDPSIARRITFRELYDPSIPEVSGNRELLIQLFLNLMKNAGEAMTGVKQPQLVLGTQYRHDFRLRMKGQTPLPIVVTVTDNGPGIPRKFQETLFDPYVSTKRDGNGLGLSIASKIATEHGGLIELTESRPGNTVFSVMLPAVRN